MSATQRQARQHLQSVRMRLSDAIKDYHDACQLLETNCSTISWTSLPRSSESELTLLTIERERLQLFLDEDVTRKSRRILKTISDWSRMTSPIYSLPSEILSRIFSEAACHCSLALDIDDVRPTLNPILISSVCRQWRKIAVSQKSLWTHIDLKASSRDYDYAYYSSSIWLERTQGAPIFVRVRKHLAFEPFLSDSDSSDHDEMRPTPTVRKLSKFLTPLMPQVCSLSLDFPWPLEYVFNVLFKSWLSLCANGRARSLRIESCPTFRALDLTLPASSSEFLTSLESLCLYNTFLPIHNLSLNNLVDLELKAHNPHAAWAMTQVEFAMMLLSCPKLRLLSIDGLFISEYVLSDNLEEQEPKPSPVTLRELLVLDIGESTLDESIERILEIVDPGPNMTTMGLPLFYHTELSVQASAKLNSLFSIGKAKTLHVYGSPGKPNFAIELGALPRVETLVFHDCNIASFAQIHQGRTSLIIYNNILSFRSSQVFWPKLVSLNFHRCYLGLAEVLGLVSSHSIQSLYMWECYDADRSGRHLLMDTRTSQAYVRQLSNKVPDVVYFQDGCYDWPSLSRYMRN
ncbi:hypothetical protein FRC12_024576 [Ceratobasidium sp. 428]|nr:hypothetical protein FRC12_024576 [Ceratobasidium sp. 428]